MDITITIPDDKVSTVVDAFATQYNYQDKIENELGGEIDNPISKATFALGIIKQFIKDVYVAGAATQLDVVRKEELLIAKTEIEGVSVS